MRNQAIIAAAMCFAVFAGGGNPPFGGQGRESNDAPIAWHKAATTNFVVFGQFAEAELLPWADRLETLRRDLIRKWLTLAPAVWTPRCAVVIHPSSQSYLAAVPGGEFTAGSSIVEADGGRIAVRRIDMRPAPVADANGTLAHELIHVLLAERFQARRAPVWAEEGIAVLEDSTECRRLHRMNFLGAMRQSKCLPLQRMFELNSAAPSDLMLVFYGQSASVTEFLVGRASPREFVRFIEIVNERGYLSALHEVYGIEDLAGLRREWLGALQDASSRSSHDLIEGGSGDRRRSGSAGTTAFGKNAR